MSREEIEKLSERLLSFANHIDRKRCAEATETDADNARDAAQALTALLAENERLRGALTAMVDDQVEYMTINKLGDPEKQHVIRAARAALTQPNGGQRDD